MNAPRLAVVCETPSQKDAVCAILEERIFQDHKFGSLGQGGEHQLPAWLLLIEDELLEAKRAVIKGGRGRDSLRAEITQIGALALAALEEHGLIDPHNGRQV